MKRNVILLLLLVLLGVGAWWMYDKQRSASTLSHYEGAFAVPDTSMIGKVSILDRQGRRLLLERQKGYWLVNEQHPAEPIIVNEMLRTLSQVEVRFIPPKSMVPNILKSLGTHGRRVDVWDLKGNLLKTYYVGGVTPDGTGTFFMMEGSNQPFVVGMKYFHGSVSVRYHLNEKDWRDLSLFPLKGKDLLWFSVEYPRQRDQSFTIRREGGKYTVVPFFDLTPKNTGQLDPDQIETYLSDLGKYKIEGYINDHPQRDSLSRLLPFCAIEWMTADSVRHAIALHPKVPTDRQGNVLTDASGQVIPVERYYVSTTWGDFMQVQNEPLKDLFAGYDLFFR